MQRVARKLEVLIPKTEKNLYYIYLKKREQVILIEYILLTKKKLSSQTIFKAIKD